MSIPLPMFYTSAQRDAAQAEQLASLSSGNPKYDNMPAWAPLVGGSAPVTSFSPDAKAVSLGTPSKPLTITGTDIFGNQDNHGSVFYSNSPDIDRAYLQSLGITNPNVTVQDYGQAVINTVQARDNILMQASVDSRKNNGVADFLKMAVPLIVGASFLLPAGGAAAAGEAGTAGYFGGISTTGGGVTGITAGAGGVTGITTTAATTLGSGTIEAAIAGGTFAGGAVAIDTSGGYFANVSSEGQAVNIQGANTTIDLSNFGGSTTGTFSDGTALVDPFTVEAAYPSIGGMAVSDGTALVGNFTVEAANPFTPFQPSLLTQAVDAYKTASKVNTLYKTAVGLSGSSKAVQSSPGVKKMPATMPKFSDQAREAATQQVKPGNSGAVPIGPPQMGKSPYVLFAMAAVAFVVLKGGK